MKIPGLSPSEVGAWLARSDLAEYAPDVAREIEFGRLVEKESRRRKPVVRRLPVDIDPHDLSQTGWGVIFARGGDPEIEHRLRPLLRLRERQAGGTFKRLRYRGVETAANFCGRKGETVGTIKPKRIPYYLLIAGGPAEIPFHFQYQLGLDHAVGRISFENLGDYGRYAQHVVDAETPASRHGRGGQPLDGVAKRPRKVVYFSVQDPGDPATRLLHQYLVEPGDRRLRSFLQGSVPAWDVEVWGGEKATRANLGRLFGSEAPGLVLVSCHGRQINLEYDDQELRQGSLLCYDPPAPTARRAFTGQDVLAGADLEGQIVLLFACYGAGTPKLDDFPHEGQPLQPRLLAKRPFVARLPQTLLARGALGVLGHVDRGWTLSFAWRERNKEKDVMVSAVASLEDSMKRLLWGDRLGHALRPLHGRYPVLAARLARALDKQRNGVKLNQERLGVLWTAVNDARNFISLGDPAVYLLGRRSSFAASVRIEPELLRFAHEQATAEAMDTQGWVNELIRNQRHTDD